MSEYQRRQMTEVIKSNVLNIAIDGSYDDCQKIVKELLQKNSFENQVISLNSINWLRVMGQTAYYVWLTKQFSSPINIAIPSGNFGNAYSAWFGRNNGLPINEIFCASNTNDVLTRFIHNGCLEPKETTQTFAPSMDIQIPSSLERLIYDLHGDTTEFYTSLQHESRAGKAVGPTKDGCQQELPTCPPGKMTATAPKPDAGTPWHGTDPGTRRFMARPGMENLGTAWHGKYWHGKILARQDTEIFGMARIISARHENIWHDTDPPDLTGHPHAELQYK